LYESAKDKNKELRKFLFPRSVSFLSFTDQIRNERCEQFNKLLKLCVEKKDLLKESLTSFLAKEDVHSLVNEFALLFEWAKGYLTLK